VLAEVRTSSRSLNRPIGFSGRDQSAKAKSRVSCTPFALCSLVKYDDAGVDVDRMLEPIFQGACG
jgi:hypothetical protein